MLLNLDRVTVIDQAANAVRKGILAGYWQERLPGERRLCKELQVGRNTLRAALGQLQSDGLIEIIPGQRTRILQKVEKPSDQSQLKVGLLSPGPIELLFPRQILWIDKLRSRLAGEGHLLKSYHGQQFFQRDPGNAILRLIRQESCSCWILVSSSKAIQEWFESNSVPCLVAGTCHHGIDLPFVDIDYQALCRHAATTLLRLGHRQIAYLTPPPRLAGDIHSEKGFLEGINTRKPDSTAHGEILHVELSPGQIVNAVTRLIKRNNRPSALLVHNALQYLSVFSVLAQTGLRIPGDISLICRESENFLQFLDPVPARYTHDPVEFAKKLSRIIGKLTTQSPILQKSNLLMPEYVDAASVSSYNGQ